MVAFANSILKVVQERSIQELETIVAKNWGGFASMYELRVAAVPSGGLVPVVSINISVSKPSFLAATDCPLWAAS
jgi:hypothetical protein